MLREELKLKVNAKLALIVVGSLANFTRNKDTLWRLHSF